MAKTLHPTIVAVLAAIFIISAATAASGQTPSANANQCLEMWSGDVNRYYREGWDQKLVTSASRINPFPAQRGTLQFSLHCGDERSGVIHIAHPETNGTQHPIAPDQYATFAICVRNIIHSGEFSLDEDSDSRGLFSLPIGFKPGAFARVTSSGQIISVYTRTTERHPQANDWGACSAT
jgi:hypothetical protein